MRIEQTPQRRYPENGLLCHALGYVGEISPEQLKQPEYRDKGYKPGDIIGQEGLESVYDEYLRGRDGYRKVIVDSRGHIQNEVERVEPQSGQDIVITIDLDLQKAAEEQLRKSPQGRGVIISMDPNNGEILALASAPTFDPNLFSQRITTKAGRAEYQKLLNDPDHPLINRAIQGKYPPGSTWKPLMATAGLKQGAISIDNSNHGVRRRHYDRQQVHALHGRQSWLAECSCRDREIVRQLLLSSGPEDEIGRHSGDG